jgi:predicted AAA+ superfamily ATPase
MSKNYRATIMQIETLKDIILEQNSTGLPNNYVTREIDANLDQLESLQQIVIITGIRRCGKSTTLQLIRQKNKEKNYYLNFDDERLTIFSLDDFQKLLELFIELYGEQKTFYFDEIQNIDGWERFVRRLHNKNYKIYITGSNASLLSKELGTHLTGRTVQVEMYPYSFSEYLAYKQEDYPKNNLDKLPGTKKALIRKQFNEFIEVGGLPEHLINHSALYLKSLYEGIIYRDIIVRYKLTNENTIKELVLYLASNISKDTSYRKLKTLLGLGSVTTVSNYIDYLNNSYLNFTINRYDRSLKKQIQSTKKNYFIDTALANAVGFRASDDRGRYLENIVFLELMRRGESGNIYFHSEKNECDFILRKGTEINTAIQVTQHLDSPKTKEREITGLLSALEAYNLTSGLLLTENHEETIEQSLPSRKVTIHVKPIWKWCLENDG